jgi:hypothetical protein
MNYERFIWIYLPLFICLFLLYKSLLVSLDGKMKARWFITVIIWAATIFSGVLLFNMALEDAWPTFLPHLIIVGCAILLFFLIMSKE